MKVPGDVEGNRSFVEKKNDFPEGKPKKAMGVSPQICSILYRKTSGRLDDDTQITLKIIFSKSDLSCLFNLTFVS